jgi:hypothetical protein
MTINWVTHYGWPMKNNGPFQTLRRWPFSRAEASTSLRMSAGSMTWPLLIVWNGCRQFKPKLYSKSYMDTKSVLPGARENPSIHPMTWQELGYFLDVGCCFWLVFHLEMLVWAVFRLPGWMKLSKCIREDTVSGQFCWSPMRLHLGQSVKNGPFPQCPR